MKKHSALFTRSLLVLLPTSLSLGLSMVATLAKAQASDPVAAPARPLTYALISAVGDRFTVVSQKYSTGSNVIDNFTRTVLKVPDNALNSAVLRGLDRALAQSDPTSVRIFMSLEAAELDNVNPQDREAVALGKIVSVVEKMPQRKDWDKIMVVAPLYMQSEYSGMGSKLAGVGVYIQPLQSGSLTGNSVDSGFGQDISLDQFGGSDTTSPDGKKSSSRRYIAPFAYIQVWTLDAKTLAVIDKNARHDFTKLFDRQSTSVNLWNSIPADVLAVRLLTLTERSAAGALGADLSATVEIGDVTAIDPKTGATKKSDAPKK